MSYRSPQQIKDGVLERSEKALAAQQEASAKRQALKESTIASNVTSLVKGGTSLVTEKNKSLNKLNKSIVKGEQEMYDKVGSDGYDTGFNKYDENSEAFLHGLISKYNETKNALDQDILIDSDMGKRQLSQIKNMVDIYGDAVPNIQLVSKMLKKQANATEKNEQFSVTGAPAHQLDIIRKISSGGNVQILNEDNSIVLFDPEAVWKDEKGKEHKGARLNISEFNKALLDKDNPYLKYKVDPSETELAAYNELVKQEEGFNDNYVTIETSTNDENEEVSKQVMTPDQQTAYINNVTAGNVKIPTNDEGYYTQLPGGAGGHNAFKTILLKGGESIWEDEGNMGEKTQWPKSFPTPGTEEFHNFVGNQYIPALQHLAKESLTNGAIENGIELQVPETENEVVVEKVEEDEKIVEDVDASNESASGTINIVKDDDSENSSITFGAQGFNTKPTEKQAENLKIAAKEPKTENGFIKANQIFEENAGRTDDGKLNATPQTEEDLRRYFYSQEEIPNKKYSDGNQKYGTKKLFPTGKPNTPVYDMAAMINMNSSWDPRIIAAIAGGEIKVDERGDYLFGRNEKELQKSIDLSTIDPQKMLNEMTDLYKNTYAKSETSYEMKKKKQLPEQYASYIERVKFIADRYGLELPKGYNEFGRPEEVTEEDDITKKVEKNNKSNVL